MGTGNAISHTVRNPITDANSEFFVEPHKRKSYIRKTLKNEMRTNPLFKRAKYIVVVKNGEAEKSYRIKGTRRKLRKYSIAILTDDNRFYYNSYNTKSTTFSNANVADLTKIFCQGYVIDNKTRILITDNINGYGEPVFMFLHIMSSITGVPILRRNPSQLMKAANYFCDEPVETKKSKRNGMSSWNRHMFIERLSSIGRFDFLPEEYNSVLTMKVKTKPERKMRDSLFLCAIGILYLFKIDLNETDYKHQTSKKWYNNQR